MRGPIRCNSRTLNLNDNVTLVINGSMETGHGSYPFSWAASGGTLKGTGVMKDDLITVPAAGILAPGYPTGTLTITNNNCDIDGTLLIEIDDGQSPKNGAVAVYGAFDVSAGTLDFNVTGATTASEYVIASYSSRTGQFATTNNLPIGYVVEYDHNGSNIIALVAETNAPTPNPMTWDVVPAPISPSKIVMTASTASDPSGGIEYYFENTTNGNNSGWIASAIWTNSGLASVTTYGYRVQARDLLGNETGWSTPDAEATTLSADNDPPTPDPPTWDSVPAAMNSTQVVMTVSAVSDPSTPIQYYFTNTINGDVSGWIASTSWTNGGLTAETTYGYHVKARDAALNETGWSTPVAQATTPEATTPEATPPTPSPMAFLVLPAALDHTRIVMTATNASDPSGGIEYYFENTTNGNSSGWITGQVWTNTGLTLGSNYGYRVKARDVIGNETDWSPEASAAPTYETTPPAPDPMTFAVAPAQHAADAIIMTATTAIDALSSPVEYFFKNTTNNNDSGWISSTVWTNSGLAVNTYYGYTVTARDALSNETVVSSEALVFLPRPPITVYWDGPNAGGVGDGDGASQGGTATWDTTTQNWDDGPDRVAWYNGSDTAILGGTAGTVTLGGSISIGNLNVSVNSYAISDNTFNFVAGGTITNTGQNVTISSAITGSPKVTANQGSNKKLFFAPTSGTVTLGAVSGNGSIVELAGSTSGNSIASASGGKLNVNCSGDWTLTGEASAYEHYLNGGDLIVSGVGQLKSNSRAFKIYGGTLHYNTPGAVYDDGNNIPGSWNDGKRIAFNGGDLDNTSGSAITASTNPDISLVSDFTFIGSLGANSDLNMGSSIVHLNSDGRQITVSNAASTLTIGGPVVDKGNAYSLTKAGSGTLALTGTSTYTGETTVDAGTLSITQTYLSDIAAVRIAAGATLDLDFVGTDEIFAVYTNGVEGPGGTWGSLASSADNKTALITGTGLLSVSVPTALEGIRYWDGGVSDIGGTGNQISAGDDGTWSTSIKNWDQGAGVVYTNWNNATNDLAILDGTAGTVTLAEDITLGSLLIDTAGYTIQGNTLNFATGGSITNGNVNNVTISSGITGSPTVRANQGSNNPLTFSPTASTMSLGAISGGGMISFAGSTSGNTVAAWGATRGAGTVQGRGRSAGMLPLTSTLSVAEHSSSTVCCSATAATCTSAAARWWPMARLP